MSGKYVGGGEGTATSESISEIRRSSPWILRFTISKNALKSALTSDSVDVAPRTDT